AKGAATADSPLLDFRQACRIIDGENALVENRNDVGARAFTLAWGEAPIPFVSDHHINDGGGSVEFASQPLALFLLPVKRDDSPSGSHAGREFSAGKRLRGIGP